MNPYDLYGTVGVGPELYIKIFAVIIFAVILLLFFKFRKAGGSGTGRVSGSPGLDLISLKKKGLLTPEELEKVGQAMLRQMEQTDQVQRRKTSLRSADELLLDPEVRRLEALAVARKTEESGSAGQAGQSGQEAALNATGSLPAEPALSPQTGAVPIPPEDDRSTVELPLDVQQLAEAGLLSPEEVENVKRRLLERRRRGE